MLYLKHKIKYSTKFSNGLNQNNFDQWLITVIKFPETSDFHNFPKITVPTNSNINGSYAGSLPRGKI